MTTDPSVRSSGRPVRLVIADDHQAMRFILARMLTKAADGLIEVVAQTPDGTAAVRAVQHFQPDAVILDVNMPYMTGIEAAREIVQRSPGTVIFGWTTDDHPLTREAMLGAGARQLFTKGEPFEPLIQALLQIVDRDDPEPSSGAA